MVAKHHTPPPDFGIEEVRISNVGVIDDLTISLRDPALLAICAGNGIGKTTILEAISILGHLPCLPTLERSEGRIVDSLAMRKWPNERPAGFDYYDGFIDMEELKRNGVGEWIRRHRPPPEANYGLIEFKLRDSRGAAKCLHEFAVLVHSAKIANEGTPRLTDIQSRGDFDDAAGCEFIFSDDRMLGYCGLALFDKHQQSSQSLDDLILKLALGRTFNIEHPGTGRLEPASLDPADGEGVDGPRSVSYVNTDLNDFGRGNDLRESPKDLKKDFGAEMVSRLRLEFDRSGSFAHLEEIRRVCYCILETPISHYYHRNVIPASFHIRDIHHRIERGAEVRIDRLDGRRAIDVNFLSAGENEVFFVTLVAINAVRNPLLGGSILLLDEPDLHIANVARSRFFEELLSIIEGHAQMIVSTHSASLFNVLRKRYTRVDDKIQVVSRVAVSLKPLELRLQSAFDYVFVGKMRNIDRSQHLLPAIWTSLSSFFWLEVARTETCFGEERGWGKSFALVSVCMMSLLLLILLGIGALVNDNIFLESEDALIYHKIAFPIVTGDIFFFLVSLATIVFRRRRARKQHERLVASVKQPAEGFTSHDYQPRPRSSR
ncbi:AAA family ATPase [Allosphingosinicella sp.]|uniref:AAA family ATPase n=1 Tax=Allosphingosinicella sp. TaxID=2823234 RepID=UPI002F181E4B